MGGKSISSTRFGIDLVENRANLCPDPRRPAIQGFAETDESAGIEIYEIIVGKDKDKTIEYLNKAYDERDRQLTQLKVDKIWDFVRDDPRFKELVKRVGIPE